MIRFSLVEEPVRGAEYMDRKCENCGSAIDVSGLPPSFGGYSLYCTVCGHHWKVD
tara:strand:+ start:3240 stop:3404 length:165 start_codon:yes stop_codon:yes gene_type:complete